MTQGGPAILGRASVKRRLETAQAVMAPTAGPPILHPAQCAGPCSLLLLPPRDTGTLCRAQYAPDTAKPRQLHPWPHQSCLPCSTLILLWGPSDSGWGP